VVRLTDYDIVVAMLDLRHCNLDMAVLNIESFSKWVVYGNEKMRSGEMGGDASHTDIQMLAITVIVKMSEQDFPLRIGRFLRHITDVPRTTREGEAEYTRSSGKGNTITN
jgi:hypothetical protein